jgi:putative FmdB family regulatory protein
VPTYQYACTACDHRFEAVQSFTDASLTECPACSGVLRKVFSSVGIVFKGSGFYRTDSRSGGGSGTAATNGTKTETNSSSESKSTTSSSASSAATSTPASAAS